MYLDDFRLEYPSGCNDRLGLLLSVQGWRSHPVRAKNAPEYVSAVAVDLY